jgi:hypothetical protein
MSQIRIKTAIAKSNIALKRTHAHGRPANVPMAAPRNKGTAKMPASRNIGSGRKRGRDSLFWI